MKNSNIGNVEISKYDFLTKMYISNIEFNAYDLKEFSNKYLRKSLSIQENQENFLSYMKA